MSSCKESLPERVAARTEGLLSRKIVGETLLVPIRGESAEDQDIYVLNHVAEFIWERLDGMRDLCQIRDEIAQEFDVSPEVAESDLYELVEQALEAGLVVPLRK